MPLKFRWETEFKETEIGEIPREWEIESLNWAVKSLESGNRPKGGALKHDPNGILSIGGENITWNGDLLLDNCLRFKEDFYNSLKKGKIEKEDILLVKDGATIGKLAFIKDIPEGKAMVNEHVFLIKTDNRKYNPRYLFYYLFSETGQRLIENTIGGSAQGGINKGILDIVIIPKLNCTEQTRIATVLSWFDDLIENKKRQNEILEKTAMAIFKSWFVDFEPFKDGEFVDSELGKIPKGWEVSNLETLTKKIISGKGRYVIKAEQGEYALWGANGILGYINEYDLEGFAILTGRVGTLGKVFLVDGKYAISDNILALIPKEIFHTIFIYLLMKSQIDFESLNVGSTQPLITKTALGNEKVIIPPPPILQKFHTLVDPLFQKIINNQKEIMVLRKIRDTLLPLLVFGKLRVDEI